MSETIHSIGYMTCHRLFVVLISQHMPDRELPPKGRSRPLGSGRSGDGGDEEARDVESRTRLLGTFSSRTEPVGEARAAPAQPTDPANRNFSSANTAAWRRSAALLTSACVLVALGFALGSLRPQKGIPSSASEIGESGLKIGGPPADSAHAGAHRAGEQAAAPTCVASSSLKLGPTSGRKAGPMPARIDAPPRVDAASRPDAPAHVEPPPRVEAPSRIDPIKSHLSPVRDPGF